MLENKWQFETYFVVNDKIQGTVDDVQTHFAAKPFFFVAAAAYSQLFCGCSVNIFSSAN